MDILWPEVAKFHRTIVYVEGKTDQIVVELLLEHLKYPGTFEVIPLGSVETVRKVLHANDASSLANPTALSNVTVIALIDADELSIADAVAHARKRLGNPNASVFCAVPTIESWLLADPELVLMHAHKSTSSRSIERIISPDALEDPKRSARQIFGLDKSARPYFFRNVNLNTAMARSASLSAFVEGMVAALGGAGDIATTSIGSQINRTVFSNLLRELPANTVGWRTMNGEYSANELADRILHGDPIGFQYLTELLRLARDILAARAPVGEQ